MRPATHRLLQPLIVLAVFAADRATKVWAFARLEGQDPIPVLPFFRLNFVGNTGAAWGMLQHRNPVLIGVTIVLLAALFYLRRRWPARNLWAQYGMTLVAGGAVGNLYDRLAFGFVVDFLDFLVWPVFNVADSCITVGALCMAWGLREREAPQKQSPGR
ncbi:MAG: signal peptidase II [Elusimicrobia bacterium]|nr:signal peptidase II [Elusimicrobiota bacterium]